MSRKKKRHPTDPTIEEQKRVLTDKELAQVEGWSAIRLPVENMGDLLGMSKSGLEQLIARDDKVRKAIEEGRSKAKSKVHMTLFRMATEEKDVVEVTTEQVPTGKFDRDGREIIATRTKTKKTRLQPDGASLRFWLQTREGFKITDKIEHTGPDGKPIRISKVKEPQTEEEILAEIAAIRARREAMKIK